MNGRFKNKLARLVVLVLATLFVLGRQYLDNLDDTSPSASQEQHQSGDNQSKQRAPVAVDASDAFRGQDDAALIKRSFEQQRSDVWVESGGEVIKTLRDDNEGSRHQKFLVELVNGHTVLIAHNIDLAPRIPLKEGDEVTFRGEFEHNDRGGVVHWTHHDPRGRKKGGWITHRSKKYE